VHAGAAGVACGVGAVGADVVGAGAAYGAGNHHTMPVDVGHTSPAHTGYSAAAHQPQLPHLHQAASSPGSGPTQAPVVPAGTLLDTSRKAAGRRRPNCTVSHSTGSVGTGCNSMVLGPDTLVGVVAQRQVAVVWLLEMPGDVAGTSGGSQVGVQRS